MHYKPTTLQQTRARLAVRTFNKYGGWLDRIGVFGGQLRAPDLIDAAKQRCGLDDFGEGDFFEPLSRLLESSEREAGLNLVGKISLRTNLLHILCNRLLMQRDRNSYPEIARQEIREPLFILGLPRSGTTILHTLLAADPNHRAPLTWEVMEPSPPTHEEEAQRIGRTARSLSWLDWLAPTFRRVHPLGAELPQECVALMTASLLSDQFDTMYYIPSYRAWFFRQNLLPAYECHRHFLQHLQLRHSAQRWVLKAPTHMFSLPTLLSAYPDALFVQTHRAPLESIASVSSLVTILRGVFSDTVDPLVVATDALHYWSETLNNFLEERSRLAPKRICDLDYLEIRRDPIAAVRAIYQHFEWPFSSDAEQRMRAVLASQPREERGSHHYNLSQFQLEPAEGARMFAPYCERFGLTPHAIGSSDGQVAALTCKT